MDFVDKLKDSLSTAGQGVGNRVTAATGGMKLNSQIKNNERMIEKLMYQVGIRCFDLQGQNSDTPYEDFFQEIRRLKEENNQLSIQTQMLTASKVCPGCGFANNSNAKFCVSCGAPLSQVAPTNFASKSGPTCPNCGVICPEGSFFCTECGKKLEQSEEPLAEQSAVAQEVGRQEEFQEAIDFNAPKMQQPVSKVCRQCGQPLSEGVLFCTNCGTKVE